MRRRALLLAVGLSIAGLLAASAYAATIIGTNGRDTLRGTPGRDTILGRGGNDRLFGLGGNDTLNGGPGRDVLDCGPGRDTAIATVGDTVRGNCENIRVGSTPPRRPPPPPPPAPPPPPPPPPSPARAGHYVGQTRQLLPIAFDVVPGGRALTNVSFSANMSCDPPSSLSAIPFTLTGTFPIGSDGRFDITATGTGLSAHLVGTFTAAGPVSGTLRVEAIVPYQGTNYRCATGDEPWQALPQ